MIILGIGGFVHDFNAAAIDTRTGAVAAAEEERFSRIRHHPLANAATTSIDCVAASLAQIDAGLDRVDVVVLAGVAPPAIEGFLRRLFPRAAWHRVPHQLCHAAAAFYSSGLDRAAILTLDTSGDGLGGLLAIGDGCRIDVVRALPEEDSIGLEFSRATCHLGLGPFGAEARTEALAAFGSPRFAGRYLDHISLADDGTFRFDAELRPSGVVYPDCFADDRRMRQTRLAPTLIAPRSPDDELTADHMDFAASVQHVLNTLALHSAKALRVQSGMTRLVLGGTMALNATTNGVIARQAGFERVTAHPSASDRGNGLGAALYYLTHALGEPTPLKAPLIYGGQRFDAARTRRAVEAAGLPYRVESSPSRAAAELLAEGRIVGWFQGRSELGARALGNRSILANPSQVENRDRLNRRVKRRGWYTPLAPSVLCERALQYFDCQGEGAYMTVAVPVHQHHRAAIPAATHEDGTARLHAVNRDANAPYHALIAEVGARTGVPIVLNASFNDGIVPIVETPEDAIACFRKTPLDALVMGDVVVERIGRVA